MIDRKVLKEIVHKQFISQLNIRTGLNNVIITCSVYRCAAPFASVPLGNRLDSSTVVSRS